MQVKTTATTMALGLVLGLGLSAAGCAEDGGAVEEDTDGATAGVEDDGAYPSPQPPPPPPPPPVLAAAPIVCPTWKQVVYRNVTGPCPTINVGAKQWTGARMFPEWGGDYDKYCAYEFSGLAAPTVPQLDALRTKPWVVEAAADCAVTGPSSVLADIDPVLRDLVKASVDTVTAAELDLTQTSGSRAPVLVAVLDTTPTIEPIDPNDDHGIVVAELIERIAHGCEPTDPLCAVLVQNFLALPRTGLARADKDPVNGGYAAMWSELAAATYTAVRQWELSKTPTYQPKLVLNFSVAWLEAFGGGNLVTDPPGVDALLLALRRASCEGALIVAAAGNDMQDCRSGPMLPGGWEELAAPTANECTTLYGVSNPVTSVATYQPLVHSVGGVGFHDGPVSVSREGGRPRLAAIADHVTLDTLYTPRTGTSMSAAVVSGIAALVWSYRPNIAAPDLAELIWANGVDTGDISDYSLSGEFAIKRATACTALTAACAGPQCPSGVNPAACDLSTPSTDALDAVLATIVPDEFDTIETVEVGQCPTYCGESVDLWVNAAADPAIPLECPALPGTAKVDYLVAPQPTNPGCPTCMWKASGSTGVDYSVSVDAALGGPWITTTDINVSVTLKLVNGSQIPYNLGNIDLSTVTKHIDLLPAPSVAVKSATIDITFVEGGKTTTVSGDLLPAN